MNECQPPFTNKYLQINKHINEIPFVCGQDADWLLKLQFFTVPDCRFSHRGSKALSSEKTTTKQKQQKQKQPSND